MPIGAVYINQILFKIEKGLTVLIIEKNVMYDGRLHHIIVSDK